MVNMNPQPCKGTMFESLDSLMNHKFHRFSSNDSSKMVYWLEQQGPTTTLMKGININICESGKPEPKERKRLEEIEKKPHFIGWVKE